jgi:hypothetical protein
MSQWSKPTAAHTAYVCASASGRRGACRSAIRLTHHKKDLVGILEEGLAMYAIMRFHNRQTGRIPRKSTQRRWPSSQSHKDKICNDTAH